MARAAIITLVNDTDNDFVDSWAGEEYIVPAHDELDLPAHIAYHFVGDPNSPDDIRRAMDRRGHGGKNAVGIWVHVKEPSAEGPKEEFILEGEKPVAKAKIKTSSKKEE